MRRFVGIAAGRMPAGASSRAPAHVSSRAPAARGRAGAWAALLGLALALSLAACTGTQEGGRPVLLVVATADGLDLVRHDPREEEDLALLPEASASLPGVVDIAVARSAGPDENAVHVLALHRQDGDDLLQVFDATAVPLGDPDLPAVETVDLSAIVAASARLPAGETLCTAAFDASADGRWLALVHDPSVCDPGAEGRAFLLVDREAEPADDAVAHFESGQFLLPRFGPSGDVAYVVDEFTPDVVAFDIPPDAPPGEDLGLEADVSDIVGFAVDGAGRLIVADTDAVVVLEPDVDAEDEDEREPQESEAGLEAVLETDWPEGSTVVVRTSSRLVVHPDLEADVEDPYCRTQTLGPIADAVVGPFSFAYVLLDESIAVADLFDCDPETLDGSTITASRRLTAPELADAVAIDWVFGVSAPDAP